MIRQIALAFTIAMASISAYGQVIDTSNQDTVFVKYRGPGDVSGYVSDTLIFETELMRHILTGTTILPWTRNQMLAKGYGVFLKKISKTACQKGFDPDFKDYVHSIQLTGDSLTVSINVNENCCYDFLADVSVDEAGALNLIYHGYGTYCDCNCSVGLTFYFDLMDIKDAARIKAVMINCNRKTLKPAKRDVPAR